MAKLVYGLMQSLDGYVDHLKLGPPRPALSRHFIEQVRHQSGCVYGRGTYEIMRYWEEDRIDWDTEDHDFAALWRRQPKWVVSRSLKSVGPNATLLEGDIEAAIRGLKAQLAGEIAVDRDAAQNHGKNRNHHRHNWSIYEKSGHRLRIPLVSPHGAGAAPRNG